MIKSETRTIGGMEFTTTQFPAMQALRISAQLAKTIGPGLLQVLGLGVDGKDLLKADVTLVIPAIADMLMRLEPTEVPEHVRMLLSNTVVTINGRQATLNNDDTINAVFTGKLKHIFHALKFVLEVNFADFFADASNANP
jgi:hypothetical protein